MFLAKFLVLFVDVEQQFLQLVTRQLVFLQKTWAHTKMERLLGLFLPRTLFETWTFASESEFNDVLRVSVFGTHLNYPFHVTAFGSNQPSCNLELFIIWDLYVEPAGIFYARIISISTKVLVLILIVVLLLTHQKWFWVTIFCILENVFILKHWLRVLLFWLLVKTRLKVLFVCKSLLRLGLAVKSRVFFFFLRGNLLLILRLFLLGLNICSLSALSLLLLFSWDPFDQQVHIVLF